MAAKEEKSKTTASKKAAPAAKKPATRRTTATTRAKPKASANAAEITDAMIAERAYFLSLTDEGSDDVGNWLRAEAELRG